MKALQILSLLFLAITLSLKYKFLGDISIDSDVVHYLFNASVILFSFSFLYPLLSKAKLKNAELEKNDELTNILKIIDEKNKTEIYVSRKYINDNAASLYKGNDLIIICGNKLLERLDKNQLKFVIAHELLHVKKNHIIKNILSFVFVVAGVPILLILLAPLALKVFNIIVVMSLCLIVYVGSFILHFLISQKRELDADSYATSLVGLDNGKKTLKILHENKFIEEKKYSLVATHPCYKKRLDNLSKTSV